MSMRMRGLLLTLALLLLPQFVFAACSSWRAPQKVWLNEYFFGGGVGSPPNFLEVYSTDNAFPTYWQNASIEVYSGAGVKTIYPLNNTTAFTCTVGSKTWLTTNVLGGLRQQNALVILRDPLGGAVDAFVFDKKAPPAPWESAALNWATGLTTGCATLDAALTAQAALSTITPNQANMLVLNSYGNKDMARDPDGGPIWDLTSNTGAGTTYSQCVSNNANFNKTVSNSSPSPGGTVTFTLALQNTGNAALAGVAILDSMPLGLTYVSATPANPADLVTTALYAATDPNTGAAGNATQISWTPASIAKNTTATLSIVAQVPADALPGYVYTNSAQTTGTALTPNQSDFATVTVGSLNVGSFVISASPATASTCASALTSVKLTIAAMTGPNGTGVVDAGYLGGAVYLSASTSNPKWYNSAGVLLPSVSPLPVGSFVNGVATLYLTDSVAETITVSALDAATYAPSSMQGTSGSIVFTSNTSALSLVDGETLVPLSAYGLANPAYGVVVGRPHRVRATLLECGVIKTGTGADDIYAATLGYTPSLKHPAGAIAPTISATPACPGAVGPLLPGGTALNLTFVAGAADFYLCASDVGQYALNLVVNGVKPGNVTLSGSSMGAFTVRPFAITASGFAAGALPNPQGAAAFIGAGNAFSGVFGAWGWRGIEDADGNGIPDAAALASAFTLATHGRPPSFSGAVNNAGTIDFGFRMQAPLGGIMGVLVPVTATAAAGSVTLTNLSYSEVGSIAVVGADASGLYGATDYLGATGLHVPLIGDVVGRFVPDHFDTEVVMAAGVPLACPAGLTCPASYNGMVYSGQPLNLRVTARNLAGGKTSNYDGALGFSRDAALTAWDAPGSIAIQNPGGGAPLPVALAANLFVAGTAEISTLTYTLLPLAAPVDIYLRVVDAEGISSRRAVGSVEGGVKVAQGRIRISNAHGSELLPLPMIATVQYYNGTSWMPSATDYATSFNTNLSPGGSLVATIVSGLAGGVSVVSPGTVTVSGGVRTFRLDKPGVRGSADIAINSPAYLPSNTARATFGVYKGNNEFIYLREVY